MVPLSALITDRAPVRPGVHDALQPLPLAPRSTAAPRPGYSSAQAMEALEEVFAQTMPREMGYDYLGMSFQEKKAQQGVPPLVDLRASRCCSSS